MFTIYAEETNSVGQNVVFGRDWDKRKWQVRVEGKTIFNGDYQRDAEEAFFNETAEN